MKIAAVLVVLSVYYIASTEQRAAGPGGIHTYPSRPWEDVQRMAARGMKDFKMNAEAYPEAGAAKDAIATDQQCSIQECFKGGGIQYYSIVNQ